MDEQFYIRQLQSCKQGSISYQHAVFYLIDMYLPITIKYLRYIDDPMKRESVAITCIQAVIKEFLTEGASYSFADRLEQLLDRKLDRVRKPGRFWQEWHDDYMGYGTTPAMDDEFDQILEMDRGTAFSKYFDFERRSVESAFFKPDPEARSYANMVFELAYANQRCTAHDVAQCLGCESNDVYNTRKRLKRISETIKRMYYDTDRYKGVEKAVVELRKNHCSYAAIAADPVVVNTMYKDVKRIYKLFSKCKPFLK